MTEVGTPLAQGRWRASPKGWRTPGWLVPPCPHSGALLVGWHPPGPDGHGYGPKSLGHVLLPRQQAGHPAGLQRGGALRHLHPYRRGARSAAPDPEHGQRAAGGRNAPEHSLLGPDGGPPGAEPPLAALGDGGTRPDRQPRDVERPD